MAWQGLNWEQHKKPGISELPWGNHSRAWSHTSLSLSLSLQHWEKVNTDCVASVATCPHSWGLQLNSYQPLSCIHHRIWPHCLTWQSAFVLLQSPSHHRAALSLLFVHPEHLANWWRWWADTIEGTGLLRESIYWRFPFVPTRGLLLLLLLLYVSVETRSVPDPSQLLSSFPVNSFWYSQGDGQSPFTTAKQLTAQYSRETQATSVPFAVCSFTLRVNGSFVIDFRSVRFEALIPPWPRSTATAWMQPGAFETLILGMCLGD